MLKLSTKFLTLMAVIMAVVLVGWPSLQAQSTPADRAVLNRPNLVATAAAPPQLTTATLGGKPVHVLYVTQSTDTILVRCYPGFAPTIALRAMGKDPKASTQKEGVMTCRAATSGTSK